MHQTLTSLKQALKVAGLAATSSAMLTLGASDAWAGQATVVTVGDSSSGGTVNFEAAPNSAVGVTTTTLNTAGGAITTSIAPGVTAQVSSQATGVTTGTITQAQADTGVGSGGAVLNLSGSPQLVAAIVQASQASQGNGTVSLPGQGAVSPQTAVTALSASPALTQLTVTTPSGATVTIAQVLSNLNAALASGDAVLLPTALNDASIAILTALNSPAGRAEGVTAELRSSGRAVAALLNAVRAASGN